MRFPFAAIFEAAARGFWTSVVACDARADPVGLDIADGAVAACGAKDKDVVGRIDAGGACDVKDEPGTTEARA